MDAVGPQVDVAHARQVSGAKVRCLAFQVSVSLVITDAESPAELPRICPSAGTKSPVERAMQVQQRQHPVIFGVFRAQGGRIAEENRQRCPVSASVRRSLIRGAITSTAPALVSTSRGWWVPLRTHQPAAVLVTFAGEPGDVGVDLGLQSLGQHPARTLADDLVDQRHPDGAAGVIGVHGSRNYGENGSYPSDRRWRADLA